MDNSLKYHHKLVNELNDSITSLLEQSDEEKKKDVESIRQDINDLRNLINTDNNSLGFKKIRIRFEEEYELKLPKYGIESFDRKLKGEMYFKVVGGSKTFMDLQTSSMPYTFKIRLTYKTLDEYKNQRGNAFLIYKRGREKLVGEEIKIDYKIIKKYEY